MAKKYKWNPTVNKLDRHDKNVYKAIGADGNTRLIKYTDEGYVELDINNGSELGSIPSGEAIKLIGRNTKPLTFEEKTAYVEKFDASQQGTYLDPDRTTLEEITTDTAMDKRLAPAYARGKQWDWEQGQASPNEIRRQQQDAGRSGESISMAEFNRQKDWEAGRRPIAENAPTARLPSDINEIKNIERTNYSLTSPGNITGGTSEYADKGGTPGMDPDFNQKNNEFNYVETKIPILSPEVITPELNTKGLNIGTGGDPGLFEVDDDFYRSKDGTLMKDSGWFGGEDTVATQADIDAGIVDQNSSSPWGSTAGWEAAGSVMKGVGGLASAYTGIKNYQLAEKAHDTQKKQWQANYDQRLRAYQDNKDLANQDIDAKNRVLRARNANRTDYYKNI